MARAELDLAFCEELAARAAEGDASACRALVEHLWPAWVDAVRSNRSMGALAAADDHVHEVVTRLAEKIGRADGRGLRLYRPWRERNPDKTFADWIRIVTKNVIRDYVREQLGPVTSGDGEVSLKRLLNEFASSPALEEQGVRPPLTAAQTARELLEFARKRLPAGQLRALALWLEGATFEDIASELGSDVEEARKLLRAGVATLRREFAGG